MGQVLLNNQVVAEADQTGTLTVDGYTLVVRSNKNGQPAACTISNKSKLSRHLIIGEGKIQEDNFEKGVKIEHKRGIES